jgi:hypothetical protein
LHSASIRMLGWGGERRKISERKVEKEEEEVA